MVDKVEKILRQVHEQIAHKFLKELQSDKALSPQQYNAMIKFLKDNDITVKVDNNDSMEEMKKLLEDYNLNDEEEYIPMRRVK
jgi:hypothetical protein